MSVGYDLNCTEVQGFTVTDTLNISTATFPVNSDLTFGGTGVSSDPTVKVTLTINGQLSTSAGATGTFSIALEFYNIPNIGTVHCQTGATPVTWTAA
jgi:hypothetical protein